MEVSNGGAAGHAPLMHPCSNWFMGWKKQLLVPPCCNQTLLFASLTGSEGARGLPRGRSLLTPKSSPSDGKPMRSRAASSSEDEADVVGALIQAAGEDVSKQLMDEALREVVARREAQDAARSQKGPNKAGKHSTGGDDDAYVSSGEGEGGEVPGAWPGQANGKDARRGKQPARGKWEADVKQQSVGDEPERSWGWVSALSGGAPTPAPSSSARKALGDTWYVDRCVVCARCGEAVRATLRAQRGVRCAGCCRWFHDKCAPDGMLPHSKRAMESDPLTTSMYHCERCKEVRAALAATAAQLRATASPTSSSTAGSTAAAAGPLAITATSAPSKQAAPGSSGQQPFWGIFSDWFGGGNRVPPSLLKEGHSLVLVDLGALRTSLAAGSTGSKAAGMGSGMGVAAKSEPRPGSGELFKRVPRYQLRTLPSVGAAQAGLTLSSSGSKSQSKSGSRELSDVRAAVSVFRTFDPEEDTEDVMEDGWAAVLRHNGAPVAAATLNVFGEDHARLQALATVPSSSRQGHATALVRELERALSSAGVGRLVAVVPGSEAARHPGALPLFSRKLGLQPLQDLNLLAGWKEAYRSYYATELIGRGANILTKPLPKQPRASPAAEQPQQSPAEKKQGSGQECK